jgi:hypothetical protein
MNGLPVQPTAQLVVLFCSWHKSKNPHLPRLNATTHVEFVSGRFGSKKRKKKAFKIRVYTNREKSIRFLSSVRFLPKKSDG